MNKLDNLIVRACKSKNPHVRLRSLYRRFYAMDLSGCEHFVNILARICDEYDLTTLSRFMSESSPQNKWMYADNPYKDMRYGVLLSTVRLSKVDSFPGYRVPRMFRDVEKECPYQHSTG